MTAALAFPMSAVELRDAVRAVRRVDARRLDRVLRVDRDRAVMEVQASVAWRTVGTHPDAAFLATYEPSLTVGQSFAENAPGPDGVPMVKHLEALTAVTADGELRRITREGSPDLFSLCVGGHGVFGAAYSFTIRLPSLEQAQRAAVAPVAISLADAKTDTAPPLVLLIPPENTERFIAEARTCCIEWHTEILGVTVRRTLPEDETMLRWACRDYAEVSVKLAGGRSLCNAVRSTQLRRELLELAIAGGGSFPISSTFEATRAHVEACYPMLGRFLAEKRRLDPATRLSNAWYRHYRSLLGRNTCEVRWASE